MLLLHFVKRKCVMKVKLLSIEFDIETPRVRTGSLEIFYEISSEYYVVYVYEITVN